LRWGTNSIHESAYAGNAATMKILQKWRRNNRSPFMQMAEL